jgi:hypothetical protein
VYGSWPFSVLLVVAVKPVFEYKIMPYDHIATLISIPRRELLCISKVGRILGIPKKIVFVLLLKVLELILPFTQPIMLHITQT